MREKLTLEQAKDKFGEDNVRKIFEIKIRDEMHPVYSIDGYEYGLRKTNVTSSSVMNDFQRQELEKEKDSFEESKDYGMINHGSVFYDGMIKWFRE